MLFVCVRVRVRVHSLNLTTCYSWVQEYYIALFIKTDIIKSSLVAHQPDKCFYDGNKTTMFGNHDHIFAPKFKQFPDPVSKFSLLVDLLL